MYYSSWIMLISISLWVSLAAFVWALFSGQFADQGRARYLPLSSEPASPPAKDPAKLPIEVYVLIILATIGLLAIASSIIVTIFRF